ncbi:MAG: CPBP family intramembrane metalloprotease [Rhodobacteraceae bacterium]|nr:CPBP family intramembrane metalloprotease [Paracoccaceae bacterium]
MFGMLFAMTVLGLVLLNRTPGFHWRDIARGWGRVDWHRVAVVGAVTAVGGYGVVLVSAPDSAFALLREHPGFMLAILVLYPVLSALPQEIVFRVLFFRRYGEILPRGPAAIGLNAAVFALAHLMYWNWIVGVMTFVGGIAFAEAYLRRRSFATAVAAHAVAGDLVFLIGLGIYFYSGYVVRPF